MKRSIDGYGDRWFTFRLVLVFLCRLDMFESHMPVASYLLNWNILKDLGTARNSDFRCRLLFARHHC